MNFSRLLLSPFALLYGAGVALRNLLYLQKILHAVKFDLPVISIGNLSVGGTGKTPFVEYLLQLLLSDFKVGTLSRGYGRSTQGFKWVEMNSSADFAGDEPLLFKFKFPWAAVAVGENRALAIPEMLMTFPQLQTIILDDAFQHRGVIPGLSILLTSYSLPYTRDYLLPAGSLREWRSAAKRAHLLVVTKCPSELSGQQREAMIHELKPLTNQRVFFSFLEYGPLYLLGNPANHLLLNRVHEPLLVTGIADEEPLKQYLLNNVARLEMMPFEDHHKYDGDDLERIKWKYDTMDKEKRILITTEKDSMRLMPFAPWFLERNIHVYVQPVRMALFPGDKTKLETIVRNYIIKTPR